VGCNSVADNSGPSSFVQLLLPPKHEKCREIPRVWPYSSSRSSKVIDLGVNGKPICDFLLVINCNFSLYLLPFSRYSHLKIENCWFYLPLPCLTPPLGRNPLEFLDETYPAKTRGMALPYGENFIILTSTDFLWYHRLTDRRAGVSIRDIACARVKTRTIFDCGQSDYSTLIIPSHIPT